MNNIDLNMSLKQFRNKLLQAEETINSSLEMAITHARCDLDISSMEYNATHTRVQASMATLREVTEDTAVWLRQWDGNMTVGEFMRKIEHRGDSEPFERW